MKQFSIQMSAILVLSSLFACGGSQTKSKDVQTSAVPGIPGPAVAAFNQGVRQLKASQPDYPAALQSFKEAYSRHPDYRVAKLNAAICLEKTGRYKEAADLYEGLVRDYVEDPSVFMAYGNALLLSGQTGPAIDQFERVISLDDKNLEAKNNLAAAYLQKGEPERSREFVKEVLAVQPDNVPALINLGMYYQRKKNMDLAMLMFNNAIGHENAKGKPIGNADVSKSMTAKKNKKSKKAAKPAKKKAEAAKIKPGKPNPLILARAQNNLGMTSFAMGIMPNAVHHFKQAIKLDPTMNEARMNVASIYLDYLAYPSALVEFQTVLKSNPNHYEAMIGAADALYGVGKYKEAADLFEKSLTINKRNVEALTRLAELYQKKLNNTQKAMATYRFIQTDLGLSKSDKAYKSAEGAIQTIKMEMELDAQDKANKAKAKKAGTAPEPAPTDAKAAEESK